MCSALDIISNAFGVVLVLLSWVIVPITLSLLLRRRYSVTLGALFFALSYYIVTMMNCSRGTRVCSAETYEIGTYIGAFIFGLVYCGVVELLIQGLRSSGLFLR